MGCRLELRHRHCIVSLSKTLYPLLSIDSTQEDPSRHNWKIVDWDVKNRQKQTNICLFTYLKNNQKYIISVFIWNQSTVKKLCKMTGLKKFVFNTNYCLLMQVKSIAKCKGSILQYFWPSLSYHLSVRSLLCLFLSSHFTLISLYFGCGLPSDVPMSFILLWSKPRGSYVV